MKLKEDLWHFLLYICTFNVAFIAGLTLTDESLKNLALIEIEKIMRINGTTLHDFHDLPNPVGSSAADEENRLIVDELAYDRYEMQAQLETYMSSINFDQRIVYDKIMAAITNNMGGIFFVYGHGGTGKTFIWKTLSAAIRSRGEIVINVASSGIASLLLPGGRTAHSTFGIPILIKENSTCTIKQQSSKAELLIRSKLIIWDEAPMMHRYCFEALDKTMKSILRSQKPFGGKVVVLGGDFRQILPVIPRGSREDIVHATINSSKLWTHCTMLKLRTNMRLQQGLTSNANDNKLFADWILKVGDGEAGQPNDEDEFIEIPPDMLIQQSENSITDLMEFVYPDLLLNLHSSDFFQERAILAPTNESVYQINELLLSAIPGDEVVHLSSDSICRDEAIFDETAEIYYTEFLNNISCSGLPAHSLRLKVGAPVMLIRNIDQSRGLCNGTRLQIIQMSKHVLNCKILTGKCFGDHVFIPRLTLVPSNSTLAVKFQRRQFPLIVSFAMTINKSQGQTLSHVGLFLPKPVFSHGQLYVALSRVTNKGGIRILIAGDQGQDQNTTTNVVYKEVFHKI